MSDDDDDNKVIDITDYVSSSKSDDELELEEFTTRFVSVYNQSIIERQQRLAKERYSLSPPAFSTISSKIPSNAGQESFIGSPL